MLVGAGTLAIGDGRYVASLALERSFRLYGIEHRGVVRDSRFDRTRAAASSARSHGLYLLLAGWMSWHRGPLAVLRAPAAFVARQDGLDGFSGPRDFPRSVGGEPYRAVQIVTREPLGPSTQHGPALVVAPPSVFEAATAVLDAGSSPARAHAVAALLERCAEAGLVSARLPRSIVADEDDGMKRLSEAAIACFAEEGGLPSLKEIAHRSALSTRQTLRAFLQIRSTFRLGWKGWRDITNEVRLRRAILMLSNEATAIGDIASVTGYGSSDALATAFRRAGLPPPRDVRAIVISGRSPDVA